MRFFIRETGKKCTGCYAIEETGGGGGSKIMNGNLWCKNTGLKHKGEEIRYKCNAECADTGM